MNHRALATLVLLSQTTLAAPLLSTTGSFSAAGPCKAAGCTLSSREPMGKTIVDERYTFPPEHPTPNQMQGPGPTFSVIRVNNVVTSVGYDLAEQDSSFFQETYLSQLITKVFSFATGAPITFAMLSQFEGKCERARGKEAVLKVGAFTLSCVNSSGEYGGARRVNYRVY